LTQARLIQLCQRAGLSLAEIKALARAAPQTRPALVETHRQTLTQRIGQLQRAEGFLAHTLACIHPITSQCPECARFAADVGGEAG
jgi:DNA-binding transcriptional MerR regulator